MEAIIRAAPISPVARQLRRVPARIAPVELVQPEPAALAPVAQAEPHAGHEHAPAPFALPVSVALGMDAEAAPEAPAAQAAEALDELTRQLEHDRAAFEAGQQQRRLEAEQEIAAARAEAESRGYAAGQEQGAAAAQEVLQVQVDRFKSLAAQLLHAKNTVLDDAEDAVVDLAFGALCRILGASAASRDGVERTVRAHAGAARAREQVGVRLHPDDLALLRPGADGPDPQPRFSADSTIELGGCIVDSSTGSLDARLETQLARLRETLLAVRAGRKSGGDQV